MPRLRLTICCVSLLLIGILQASHAAENGDNMFSLSGFGTLGLAHSNTDQADVVRDLSQPSGVGHTRSYDFGLDSLFGLQLNIAPAGPVDGVIQVVSHRRYDGSFSPDLTWAYLRYNADDNTQLRFGRLGFDVYMLADTRNIAYAYLWARPPIEYFGILPLSYIDGADLARRWDIGNGFIRVKAYAGLAHEQVPVGNSSFSLYGNPVIGMYLEYQSNDWIVRAGQAKMRFKNEFPYIAQLINTLNDPQIQAIVPSASALANGIGFDDKNLTYSSAGASYQSGPIQLQLMLSRITSESWSFPDINAGYITAGYRINKVTPYLTYSRTRSSNSPVNANIPVGINPALDALSVGVNLALNGQRSEQSTWSLGARYDVSEKTAIKLQIDKLNSSAPLLQQNVQAGWNGKALITSLTVDFVF